MIFWRGSTARPASSACWSSPATAPNADRSGGALDAIDSGVLRRRGIRSVGIAGYPDGHPRIGGDELYRAMAEKIAAAEATGLRSRSSPSSASRRARSSIMSRGCALSASSSRCASGLPGPTSLAALLRYAGRCGVRASAQGLAQRAGLLRGAFAMAVPDDLVRSLAEASPANVRPHFFSFGGMPASAHGASAADGRIKIDGDADFESLAAGTVRLRGTLLRTPNAVCRPRPRQARHFADPGKALSRPPHPSEQADAHAVDVVTAGTLVADDGETPVGSIFVIDAKDRAPTTPSPRAIPITSTACGSASPSIATKEARHADREPAITQRGFCRNPMRSSRPITSAAKYGNSAR